MPTCQTEKRAHHNPPPVPVSKLGGCAPSPVLPCPTRDQPCAPRSLPTRPRPLRGFYSPLPPFLHSHCAASCSLSPSSSSSISTQSTLPRAGIDLCRRRDRSLILTALSSHFPLFLFPCVGLGTILTFDFVLTLFSFFSLSLPFSFHFFLSLFFVGRDILEGISLASLVFHNGLWRQETAHRGSPRTKMGLHRKLRNCCPGGARQRANQHLELNRLQIDILLDPLRLWLPLRLARHLNGSLQRR